MSSEALMCRVPKCVAEVLVSHLQHMRSLLVERTSGSLKECHDRFLKYSREVSEVETFMKEHSIPIPKTKK